MEKNLEFAGLRRDVQVALCLSPLTPAATSTAKALAALIGDEPAVPVRLVGLSRDSGRVHLTVAVVLGSVDDVKVAAPNACAAVSWLHRVVDTLSASDPGLVLMPDPTSAEALVAAELMRAHADLVDAVQVLATVG